MRYNFSDEDVRHFIGICNEAKSMSEAAQKLNLHFNTFKRYALKFNCYKPNRGGKGLKKRKFSEQKLKDILDGKHPNYQTYKLKQKLLDEGILKDECELCGWSEKVEGKKYSNCELHHKNGDRRDHRLENLQILCPNCHSLTKSYRARNKK